MRHISELVLQITYLIANLVFFIRSSRTIERLATTIRLFFNIILVILFWIYRLNALLSALNSPFYHFRNQQILSLLLFVDSSPLRPIDWRSVCRWALFCCRISIGGSARFDFPIVWCPLRLCRHSRVRPTAKICLVCRFERLELSLCSIISTWKLTLK